MKIIYDFSSLLTFTFEIDNDIEEIDYYIPDLELLQSNKFNDPKIHQRDKIASQKNSNVRFFKSINK